MKNYYEILEVNKKASREIIEKAYKVLIKKYHPDLYEGEARKLAEERAKDINEAYKILSDEFLREQYDKELQKENDAEYYERYNKNARNNKRNDTRKEDKEKINANSENVNEEKLNNDESKTQIGTFGSIINIVKELFSHKPDLKKVKNVQREDMIAAGLSVLIVVVLGLILWFVPFTHDWIKGFLMPFSQG